MDADKMLLGLYFIAVAFVLYQFFSTWSMAIAFLLVLLVALLQKISLERKLEREANEREKALGLVEERVGKFSEVVGSLRSDFNRSMFVFGSRLSGIRAEIEADNDRFAGKLIEIENRIAAIKKTLGAAYGSVDERLHVIEEETEEKQ